MKELLNQSLEEFTEKLLNHRRNSWSKYIPEYIFEKEVRLFEENLGNIIKAILGAIPEAGISEISDRILGGFAQTILERIS